MTPPPGDADADVSSAALCRHAERVARIAGQFARDNMHRRGEVDARFPHDVKLRMDRETQDVAEAAVAEAFPRHAVLGEEGARGPSGAEYRWVIDPIDGTVNYFTGIPHWCCSIAVQRHGRTVAGAVYHPPLDECFSAAADGPACRNGERIRASGADDIAECCLLTGGLPRVVEAGAPQMQRFIQLMRKAGKIRILGAAALDLCYVACGRVDAVLEYGLSVWDVEAGRLIAERAGAFVKRFDVEPSGKASYLVAAPGLREALLPMVCPG